MLLVPAGEEMLELPPDTRPLSVADRGASATLGKFSLLIVTVPMLWVSLAWTARHTPLTDQESWILLAAAAAASFLLLLDALLFLLGTRLAFWLYPLSIVVALVPFALRARQVPDVAFVSVCWGAIVTYFACSHPFALERPRLPTAGHPATVMSPVVLTPACCALILAAFAAGHRVLEEPLGFWSVAALLLVPAVLATAVEWVLLRHKAIEPWRVGLLGAATGAAVILLPWTPLLALIVLAARVLVALVGAARSHDSYGSVVRFFWRRPAFLVVLTFLLLGLLGGIVLTFPACTTRRITDLDALFTSVSACCVTGLTVLDTPVDFTFAGQLAILTLIQVGGLGIMTLSAVAILILGGALPSEEEKALAEVVGAGTPGATVRLVKAIAVSTFLIEAVGAVLLFPGFLAEGSAWLDALWKSVFHSIAAFCNAGFALQSTNLTPYRNNPYILHVIATLIILGGIGFGVLVGLYDWARRTGRHLTLHVKVTLLATLLLLVGGSLLYLVFEWNASLRDLSIASKLHNAWFQSVTPRTAGFNSLELRLLRPSTILVLIVLMFVGASPISTGGGIKTTTAAVLLLAVRATLGVSGSPQAFGKEIPTSVLTRAATVATLSVLALVVGSVILLCTQTLPFDSLVFEAVSAFGTVGLSLGATQVLDSVGKVVIICLMIVGRTGPLTVVLMFQQQRPHRLRYPKEEVIVG